MVWISSSAPLKAQSCFRFHPISHHLRILQTSYIKLNQGSLIINLSGKGRFEDFNSAFPTDSDDVAAKISKGNLIFFNFLWFDSEK